ncbi:vesicular acetylcholine transporter unc-17-like [Asterias rubens]|uniref:vesicular acetylcholine transporter unc-17-like n=1 Tax=Asterias rubens TaxID=7604 RepID=UPI0014550252|nr:vesicular acetylcholine transporter unc-17-like [Asterias rubens]
MHFYGGNSERWLRVFTSIGCQYLDSCMHGAVVPLLTEVQWQHQSSNATIGEISKGTASFALAATFMSTGIVEVLFSPIAGLVADRWGLDIVLLFGLLCSTFKCLLYGLTPLTPLILLTNRCLQGVVSACTQTMAMARIRDIYDEASLECTIVTGVAMCKLSFNLFAALFVGELFRYLNNRVFLLFLSIELILIVGVLLTFRTENFHKKEETRSDQGADDATSQVDQKKHRSVRWRVIFDVQVLIVALSFLVSALGYTALEPTLAVWVDYMFGDGTVSTAHMLGLCGFSVLLSTACCVYVLGTLSNNLTWIFCFVSLCTAGLPLVLVKFSPSLTVASIFLAVFFFGSQAARVILITMCSTIAVKRHPEAYSLVFSIVNLGWGGASLFGPLVAPFLFGSSCTVCMIGVAYILTALLALLLRNLDSKDGINFMDCYCAKAIDDDGYQLVVTNEDIPFTFEQRQVMIQTTNK